MNKIIRMPSFGSDMAKGTVAEWLVKPGDTVHRGDVIATIDTMKGLIDLEVFDEGVVDTLLVPTGEQLPVGEPIARLRLAGDAEQSEGAAGSAEPEASVVPEAIQASSSIVRPQADAAASSVRISPAARQRAGQLGIDWRTLGPGSGPDGALVLADIEGLAPSLKQQDSDQQMRQAIAAVVIRSKREIPHYYLEQDIPLARAQAWCTAFNQGKPTGQLVLVNALIFCALARALAESPRFNGFYRDGHYQSQARVHLGNVIHLRGGGLVVAAIHDAHSLGVERMMTALRDQVIRAREGGLRSAELQEATVTVSSLGERGVDRMQGVIFPPQVALLGIGRVRSAPWVQEQSIIPMTQASFSLAADHRVSDGHEGARLLNRIDRLLQQPEQLE
ncbi:dihydrolipoamide acetyltransferase family protein [Oceanimonas sp. CHS3-5]|uniref:dihydrolipoamide acetyltransferase family protein n=1 Tax=Oceanimonas sp. CHS3-5 TaxID=3068186 RepID=UPI00273D21EA|nr:dihydrolipoamide acetyltransferase family protein [Oceanimonas sp. CHS3-5]MDP5291380.1 dihydrolipoamide acetyltransferase family protein [Oceanimonas sp. CHS3-5]